MDAKGGTITWHLTANDADFNAAMLRTRAEARKTGRDVDREFGKGMRNAQLSLDDFRRDLNRSAQLFRDFQIALRGFQMTSLILGVTLAGGAIIELVGALAAASQSVIALPGILAPVIGAFGALQVATYGVGDAFKAVLKGDMDKLSEAMEKLSPAAQEFVKSFGKINEAFKPIRTAVQEAFFDGLGQQIENVAKATLPTLEIGLGKAATAMNGLLKEAARVAQEPFFQGMIANTLETTAQSTNILKGAVEPLAQALAGLVQIGLPFQLMLSQWVVDLSKSAALYINSAEGQKELTGAIELGIAAFKQLGDLIGSLFGLFVALFQVSNQEGLSLIGTLSEIIDKTTAWVKSAEGQEKLTALFQVANTFLREGASLIGGFVSGLLGLVEQFNKLPDPVKDVATNLVLMAAVAGPVLGYLSSIGASLNLLGFGAREAGQAFSLLTGVDLAKNFKGIADSGGLLNNVWSLISKNPLIAVLTLLAGVFVYLGTQTTIFQDAFKQLQPVFETTWQALQPLFEVLGQLAAVLGGAIATIIPVIAEVFGQILAALLPLIPPLLQLVMTLLPIFVQVLQFVVQVIQFLIPIITVLAQIIGAVLVVAINILVAVFQFVIGVVQAVANAFVAAWNFIVSIWNGAGAFFKGLWDGIVAVFSVVGQFFSSIFSAAWEGIKAIWNFVVSYYKGVWNGIVTVFNVVASFFSDIFQKAWNGVKNIWNAVGGFFSDIWDKIKNAFSGVVDLGRNIVDGLAKGISDGASAVIDKVKEIAAGALNAIKSFFGIKSPSRVMAQMGIYLMQGFGKGIDRTASTVVDAAKDAATGVLGAFDNMSASMSGVQSDFTVTGTANGAFGLDLAPPAVDSPTAVGNTGPAAVIYQTNEVHTDLDMDQVNRNLTWELGKL